MNCMHKKKKRKEKKRKKKSLKARNFKVVLPSDLCWNTAWYLEIEGCRHGTLVEGNLPTVCTSLPEMSISSII